MEQLPATLEEIIQKSIQLEEEGYKYYSESAQKVKNSLGKRTLERLANDEKIHIKRFTDFYQALTKNELDLANVGEENVTTFEELFDRLKDQLNMSIEEMSDSGVEDAEIIEMALDLENHTRFFYEEAAKQSDNEQARKLYTMLAREEKAHYDVLRKTLDFLDDPSLFFGMSGSKF